MIGKAINFFYSLYFNLRYLPFSIGVRMPILIRTNMKIEKLQRGQIIIKNSAKRFSVRLGGGKSPAMNASRGCLRLDKTSKLYFRGKVNISQGTVIRCDKDGVIEFGDKYYCNCNCYFRSGSKISFGDNCSLGWNVTINTSDGHHVWHNGVKVKMESPVRIGNHVWLTPDVTVLKNVSIPDNCIVTQKSVVTKEFKDEHCLIGGIPANVISYNIDWEN